MILEGEYILTDDDIILKTKDKEYSWYFHKNFKSYGQAVIGDNEFVRVEADIVDDKIYVKEILYVEGHDSYNEKQNILKTYDWIKIKKYKELKESDNCKDQNCNWQYEYFKLLNHHKKETEFLIQFIRNLIKNN
jgi:hypothetical protein